MSFSLHFTLFFTLILYFLYLPTLKHEDKVYLPLKILIFLCCRVAEEWATSFWVNLAPIDACF